MSSSLLDKVWDAHTVRRCPRDDAAPDRAYPIHEVTSPAGIPDPSELKVPVRMPARTLRPDHIIPTTAAAAVLRTGGRG
jgi:homoaconitase/3-isopropylmalate dehydratase large subunit